jgi:hypothetical protein
MLASNAFWKFYADLTKFNLGLSLLIGVAKGTAEGLLSFATGGMVLSILAYEILHSNEYNLYYNLGFTKRKLLLGSWLINAGEVVVLSIISAM